LEEWNRAKRGFEWLFPAIGQDENGQISSAEYKELSGVQTIESGLGETGP
jgi:hypothetical protein